MMGKRLGTMSVKGRERERGKPESLRRPYRGNGDGENPCAPSNQPPIAA
jgi:hypothetical protein